ncbi:hypothetical protein SAY87_011042 [Trapa incisa]|uniref:F-box domain-containing protein n=1 Tax=Trapa incisa TaxID=236973 RepID=A0AAN7JIT0_9MYRT|nr:hypothetical protein SAY87_011042 [Trapa incisa]
MSSVVRADLSSFTSSHTSSRVHPEPAMAEELPAVDHFDRLPDPLLLLVFNKVADVKSLGRFCVVSRRFHSLVPQVGNVFVRVDCVISDDDSSSHSSPDKSRSSISSLFKAVFSSIGKPFQALGQLFGPKRSASMASVPSAVHGHSSSASLSMGAENDGELDQGGVTHHSPTQVLKNFNEIQFLRIELPSGELGIDDGALLRWRADFGSTLDSCVILGASSVIHSESSAVFEDGFEGSCSNYNTADENGNLPESFYSNGGLKLRVVWTISSLIAASARHYLLQPIIQEHKTVDSLVLTDADGQGILCMNRDQLDELRTKPLSVSSASKRTLVPALNMRLWYAPCLELPNGMVLKGATLVAIRPSEHPAVKNEVSEGSWISSAFEEPYGTAAKMLVKRRTYCLEMNSF